MGTTINILMPPAYTVVSGQPVLPQTSNAQNASNPAAPSLKPTPESMIRASTNQLEAAFNKGYQKSALGACPVGTCTKKPVQFTMVKGPDGNITFYPMPVKNPAPSAYA
ncbi:MAG: hypothetical protein VKJ06_09295 [Vampirovibrionales bacterium]|nr:hypothetical protein [Vampirovibrionales bacterium]